MQVYFSHSYRDVTVNGYFLEHFVEEDLPLRGDQKSEVWCVAKLERFVAETTGFISIITRRPNEKDPGAYSPYIGHELNLARRGRVPRLLFVDQLVLERHPLDFPEDAVSFRPEALEDEKRRHATVIRDFTRSLESAVRPPRGALKDHATIITAEGAELNVAAQDLQELLRRSGFSVTMLAGRRPGRGLDDIRLLETLWRAELCVFLLADRLSEAHIALAMAHAHGIPSVRLQYDRRATDCTPSLTGVIRWSTQADMIFEFGRQVESYRNGLVQPVQMALTSSPTEAARSLGTTKGWVREDNYWRIDDGPALMGHVHPDHSPVRDEVDRVRAQLRRALGRSDGREGSLEVCALLYEGLRRHRYAYEIEMRTDDPGTQAIRTPRQIQTQNAATCIDIACLFASVLEAAGHNPILVVLEGPNYTHALAGYRVLGEPPWETRSLSDLRGAVARRDAVLFEATGVLESDELVGAETADERQEKLIASFEDARHAATRMVQRDDVQLIHFADIRQLRAAASDHEA